MNAAVNVLILFLLIVWLALAYWTWADARRRIDDGVLVTTAAVLGLVPFVGPIIYTILRPPEFLEDRRERELEMKAAELRLRHLVDTSCPRCEHPVERNWLRCPGCSARLKDPCRSCSRPVDPRWSVCPHCETQLASRSRRSRSEGRGDRPPSRSSSESKSRKPPPRSSSARPPQKRSGTSSRGPSSESRSTRPPKRRATTSGEEGSSSSTSPSGKEPKPRSSGSDGEGERPRRRPTTPRS